MKELKEGMVVRCTSYDLVGYGYGKEYSVGYDSWRDFGVLDDGGRVVCAGCFEEHGGDTYYEQFSWTNFELVSEPEDNAFTVVEVPHYKGQPVVLISHTGKWEMFKYQSGASGIVIRKSDGEVFEFSGVTALEF